MIWITTMAKDYINSHSFDFASFSEAKYKLSYTIESSEKVIIYDRLSLCIYSRNLLHEEYRQFSQDVRSFYKPPNNDYEKRRIEYAKLFYYYWCKPKFSDYIITKTERPDFLLQKGSHTIGIEVTQLTTPYEKVMGKISLLSEKGLMADELKLKAIAKHGQKANNYQYNNFADKAAVGTNTLHPDKIRELHVQQIIDKYKDNESNIKNYSDFIILCDAQDGITYTSENDIADLQGMLSQYLFSTPFSLAILWLDNGLKCSEFRFGDK